MDHLVSTHILLGESQKKQLRMWAADRGTSMATLVREAVDYYLRVAVGPSPEKIRRAARDAVGRLPLDPPGDADTQAVTDGLGWLGRESGDAPR